jgi:N-acetylglucosaminyl-diphospho-decaprenol L-rhamnosyltransferase
MPTPEVTVSIVSHRQNALVNGLLGDLNRLCAGKISLVLTENIPDPTPLSIDGLTVPVQRIANDQAKGFGANHNAAFAHCRTPFYCVANPDVRLNDDPFPALIAALAAPDTAVAGPLVRNPSGTIEDSARRFPTLASLTKKLFVPPAGPDYDTTRGPVKVDWVAGMFMLFRSDAYRAVGGFDERFFLYYEDIDICRRLATRGQAVIFDPTVAVTHDARRASRRDPRLMAIHAASVARYLGRSYR